MKIKIVAAFFLTSIGVQAQFFKADPKPVELPNVYEIVPEPVSVVPLEGKFILRETTKIVFDGKIKEYKYAPPYFVSKLNPATGYKLTFDKLTPGDSPGKNAITFMFDKTITDKEAYKLEVQDDRVIVKCSNGAGAFYAAQTILQLMSDSVFYSKKINNKIWTIPCVKIEDYPRFAYRGMHLDCARHLFNIDFIKRYIDLLSMNKMNTFHWHLTDDQGWRIEIKKYPKLTQVGGFRKGTVQYTSHDKPGVNDKIPYGGFYTQVQIKEIVKYAQSRYVTIIPEIEMPGHAMAALAAYPEYACKDTVINVGMDWGVFDEIFCPTEKTFTFLQDILNEVTILFPSKYIHIGGDEAPKTRWKESKYCQDLMKKENLKDEHELQSYFIKRIEKYLNTKQREIIGWDEILEGGISPKATIMSWRGMDGAIEAAKQNHDAIMTPGNFCYFDHYQSLSPSEPYAIGGFTSVEKVYSFEPIPAVLNEEQAKHILGAQGNLWTEYIGNTNYAEYMIMPRQCALAEVLWTPKEKRNYSNFTDRMLHNFKRLDLLKVNYARHMMDVTCTVNSSANQVTAALKSQVSGGVIYYTTDGSTVSANANAYKEPVIIDKTTTLKAACFKNGSKVGTEFSQKFLMHKGAGSEVKLANPPASIYYPGNANYLTNGIEGSSNYGDGQWFGFSGKNLDATIDLGSAKEISKIKINYLVKINSWIYAPAKVIYSVSTDGVNYKEVYNAKVDDSDGLKSASASFNPETARYLKIVAENIGVIADGKSGAGNPAWLFVDEVVVE